MNFLDNYFNYNEDNVICGLTNELNVFYVLGLFQKLNKNVIVLTSSIYEANNYYNLFQTYSSDVLLFLMDDFLSSMVKATSPELKLTRLNTLERISEGKHIIITNLMGYLKYLPSVTEKENNRILLEKGTSIERDVLLNKINDFGYVRESMTTTTGEYSQRGMVLDIFLINDVHPIRIEFDDNTVDNIRYFDEITQRTINSVDKVLIKPISENTSTDHSSLLDYLEDSILVKIESNLIDTSYQKLCEDILEYKESSKDTSDFMNYEL